ncbi:MAG: RNA polymerase sigma factor SigJ [Thermomicrobiales bacterium]
MSEIQSDAYQSTQRYLFAVAYRMTGSANDAEDLVHDAWLRYLNAGSPAVTSLRAYLTTIVSHLALDYLKSARVQREQYVGTWMPEPVFTSEAVPGPAETAEQREEVSFAFLTLLEQLTPEQRIVYVLREGFGLAYDEIARHVCKSSAACRQIYSRAHRILLREKPRSIAPPIEHLHIVEQFLAALSTGNVTGVAALIAEDAFSLADGGPHRLAARKSILGRDKVARGLVGWASKLGIGHAIALDIVELNGAPAIVLSEDGILNRVVLLDTENRRIIAVRTLLNPDKLRHLNRSLAGVTSTLE